MIRGIGVLVISTYSQTLNVQECVLLSQSEGAQDQN